MLEFITMLLDLVLNLNDFLDAFISEYGLLVYVLFFTIIICETGFFCFFLPGDSLIFAVAAFAARGSLDIKVVIFGCIICALLGDNISFTFGSKFGDRIYNRKKEGRIIKKKYMDQASAFYKKHGGKAIILSRFVPIVRSFVPFVAGFGQMTRKRFVRIDVIGVCLWVLICSTAGYFFGNIPFVQEHFEFILIGIIFVSLMPMLVAVISSKLKANK